MENSRQEMIDRSTLVIIDDDPEWLTLLERMVKECPEANGLDIKAFQTIQDAVSYVKSNATQIVGFIQDLNLSSKSPNGISDGVLFLDEIIASLTPWARTLIFSGFVDDETVEYLYRSDKYEVQFLPKTAFDEGYLRSGLAWLRQERESPSATDSLEENTKIKRTLEVLEPPWNEICRYLSKHPDFLHMMDPRAFEKLVAEFFRSHGWNVELTARTRDGGYDIIAVRRSIPTNIKVLVEAKRFKPDRPVGINLVRALYGVRSIRTASQVVLATSSYVSRPAKREFSRVIPWELDFIERDKILNWCKRYRSVQLLGDFADES